MATVTKFDVEKFDGKISFSIWQIQMKALLVQNRLKKALDGVANKPAGMSDEKWKELDETALTAIQLCLSKEVLREVVKETTTVALWKKLEDVYMANNLANKLRLKERLYTIRMPEGTSVKSHLDEFNSILMDMENLDIKIDDEDKAVLLVVSLQPSFKHFKEIMLYGNKSDTLSYDDVKSNLLSKEKFDEVDHSSDKAEGLSVSGKPKRRGRKNISCYYCKKTGHIKAECPKWKRLEKEERCGKNTAEADIAETGYDGDVLLAVTPNNLGSADWVLDSGSTYHVCPRREWFSTYKRVESGIVHMGNGSRSRVYGIGTIRLNTHDGIVRSLTNVHHVPGMKVNLVSLGTLESSGCAYSAEGGVLKVCKDSVILFEGKRDGGLYVMRGSTVTTFDSISVGPSRGDLTRNERSGYVSGSNLCTLGDGCLLGGRGKNSMFTLLKSCSMKRKRVWVSRDKDIRGVSRSPLFPYVGGKRWELKAPTTKSKQGLDLVRVLDA